MPSTYLVSTGTPLSLGSVTFYDVEHPDELPLEFKQNTVVQELIGGGRVVQTLGVQPKEIRWNGFLFEDNTVEVRVQDLTSMCAAGSTITLRFAQYTFDVIITDFKPSFYATNYAKYEIVCEVVQETCGLFQQNVQVSVDAQTNALFTSANNNAFALSMVDPTFNTSTLDLQTIQTNIQSVQSIASASQSSLQPILSMVNSASQVMSNYLTPLMALAPGQLSFSTFQQIANATKVLNALNLISGNLQNGQSALTIQAIGGDLIQLSSMYYGDPSLYTYIKEANNLTSYKLPPGVMTTLQIPPVPSSS